MGEMLDSFGSGDIMDSRPTGRSGICLLGGNRVRKHFSNFVLDHSKLFIALNLLLAVFFSYQSLDLQIKDDILNYLPEGTPEVEFYEELGDVFQGNDIGLVVIEAEEIFAQPVLAQIQQLTDALQKVDGIASVTSLTNVMDMRSEDDALQVQSLLRNELDYSPAELAELKEYTLGKEMYRNNLVSTDGRYSMIMLKLAPDASYKDLAVATNQIIAEQGGEYQYYLTGIPFVSNEADISAKGDLAKFLPAVILVVLAVLFISFRSLRGVLLPMIAVIISVIWTMGLMVMLGKDLSTIGIAIPVILIAVGSAYGIHVMNAYASAVTSEAKKKEEFAAGLQDIAKPLLLSGLTTIVGFISLQTAELTPIKEFGFFTAFGVFAALITAYTFIPAVLVHLPYRKKQGKAVQQTNNLAAALAQWLIRNRVVVVVASVLVVLVSIAVMPRLNFDTDYADAFRPNAPTRQAIDLVSSKFGGTSILDIHVQGDLQNPFVLKQLDQLAQKAEAAGARQPLSYVDLIKEANKVINESDLVPDTRDKVASLGLFLEGQEILKDYVTSDYSQGLVIFRLPQTSSQQLKGVTDQVRELIQEVPTTYYHIDRDAVTNPEFHTYLDSRLVEDLTLQVSELVGTAASPEQIRETLNELNGFQPTTYLLQHPQEITEILAEELDPDYAGFPVQGGQELERELYQALVAGGGEEELTAILAQYNPEADLFDLEDLAFYIVDDVAFLLADAQSDALDQAALQLAGSNVVDTGTLVGLLREVWSSELYLAELAEEYKSYPEVTAETFELTLTGPPVIYEIVTDRLFSSQAKSLLFSLVLVFILLMLQLGNVGLGLIALTPIVLTVIVNFGVMALRGISLNVATTMIASIAIGIGIDYTIHFTNRFRLEDSNGADPETVLQETFAKAGKAIISNAAAVALGFLVLIFSSTMTVAYFGGLTALTMLVSALTAITLLPSLLLLKSSKTKVQKGVVIND